MTLTSNLARVLLASALAAAAPASSAPQSADLTRLKSHIAAVQTMTASFIQTDARGRSAAGTLQLKRPGHVRFQYGSGDLLLVANGKTLAFMDYQVGQKSSWPLGRTPLGVLLSNSPDFNGKAEILPSDNARVVGRPSPQHRAIWAADARLPPKPLGAGRPAALRLDRDRSAEPPDDGQAIQRAVQRCGPGKRVHLRQAEEAIG